MKEAMKELATLKRENKNLKKLLKNAVELLEKYKTVLTRAASRSNVKRAAPTTGARKKTAKK